MSRQGDFLIYCVETYKNAKHLTGRQVAELFTRYPAAFLCASAEGGKAQAPASAPGRPG